MHDDLLPGEHARLHARYAAAIEAEPTWSRRAGRPAEIAHHWYAAHDHPRALVAAHAAADDAGRRYAYAEQPGCWSGSWSCGSRCPTRPSGSASDHLDLLE